MGESPFEPRISLYDLPFQANVNDPLRFGNLQLCALGLDDMSNKGSNFSL